jgi:hypothetical protein
MHISGTAGDKSGQRTKLFDSRPGTLVSSGQPQKIPMEKAVKDDISY